MSTRSKKTTPAVDSDVDANVDMVAKEKKPNNPDVVKKAELIDKIVERTGLKKRDVKPSVEAALEEFAATLLAGKSLNLPPMGKIKMMKCKDLENGAQVLTLKMRTTKPSVAVDRALDVDAEAAPIAAE